MQVQLSWVELNPAKVQEATTRAGKNRKQGSLFQVKVGIELGISLVQDRGDSHWATIGLMIGYELDV